MSPKSKARRAAKAKAIVRSKARFNTIDAPTRRASKRYTDTQRKEAAAKSTKKYRERNAVYRAKKKARGVLIRSQVPTKDDGALAQRHADL